jgi:hypothetical protein
VDSLELELYSSSSCILYANLEHQIAVVSKDRDIYINSKCQEHIFTYL